MSALSKFLRTMFIRPVGYVKKTPKPPYDVMLSLWNIFRNREQRKGFENNGLSVRWIGNHYPPEIGEVSKRSFAWIPFVAFMFSFRIHSEWLKHFSMTLFDWYSGSRKLNCRLVWAYVEMNTRLLRKAKSKGIPVILDNPIAHMRDYYNTLKPEYESLGMNFHAPLISKWATLAEKEYELADWFNVGSRFVKKTLAAHGVPESKIIVNHTGVDVSRWAQACSNRKFGDRKMTFVSTGYIGVRKGTHYLVKAWIKANLQNARLILCGGGSLPWEKICQTPLPESIIFMGAVNHDKLAEIYANSDVYVLPSLLEGFARAGLEAMASGLPLLITEETGLTDLCDDGKEGWIVPAKDAGAIAARMQWCMEHPDEVRAAGEAASEKMRHHDFTSYGNQCAEIAKCVIAGKQPPLELG